MDGLGLGRGTSSVGYSFRVTYCSTNKRKMGQAAAAPKPFGIDISTEDAEYIGILQISGFRVSGLEKYT